MLSLTLGFGPCLDSPGDRASCSSLEVHSANPEDMDLVLKEPKASLAMPTGILRPSCLRPSLQTPYAPGLVTSPEVILWFYRVWKLWDLVRECVPTLHKGDLHPSLCTTSLGYCEGSQKHPGALSPV